MPSSQKWGFLGAGGCGDCDLMELGVSKDQNTQAGLLGLPKDRTGARQQPSRCLWHLSSQLVEQRGTEHLLDSRPYRGTKRGLPSNELGTVPFRPFPPEDAGKWVARTVSQAMKPRCAPRQS